MEKTEPQSAPPTVEHDQEGVFTVYDNLIHNHMVAQLVIVSWIIFLWELYLTFRQRRLVQRLEQPPQVLDGLIEADVYHKARTYFLDKSTFEIVHEVYSNIINTIFMTCWGFYFVWLWGEYLVEFIGLDPKNEIYATAGCVTVMRIYSTILSDLPFTTYSTFVLEQKHNFNNQSPGFFIKDQILKFVVTQVLMVPLICATVWIVKNGGDYFFLYLWLFSVVMSLVLMIIYPEVIAPLFDKYTPLPEGNLKNRIEALASSLNYPLYKLYIVEGSRRSSHSNAYLYGFYKYKRIVLFDTLVAEYQKKKMEEEEKAKAEKENSEGDADKEKKEVNAKPKESRGCETDEIIAVLSHELGHWQYSHALQGFLFGQVIFLFNFISFAQLLHHASIYEAFGFTDSKPVLIGLMVVTMYVLAPLNKLLSWALTVNTRRFEFQADRFAASLGHGEPLQRALVKLYKDNLGYPLYDKLYSNWHHSHPPLLERLDAIKKEA